MTSGWSVRTKTATRCSGRPHATSRSHEPGQHVLRRAARCARRRPASRPRARDMVALPGRRSCSRSGLDESPRARSGRCSARRPLRGPCWMEPSPMADQGRLRDDACAGCASRWRSARLRLAPSAPPDDLRTRSTRYYAGACERGGRRLPAARDRLGDRAQGAGEQRRAYALRVRYSYFDAERARATRLARRCCLPTGRAPASPSATSRSSAAARLRCRAAASCGPER